MFNIVLAKAGILVGFTYVLFNISWVNPITVAEAMLIGGQDGHKEIRQAMQFPYNLGKKV